VSIFFGPYAPPFGDYLKRVLYERRVYIKKQRASTKIMKNKG
jgi:hypothetical protein